ncbi:MAG: TonB-dependent receptor [bacterium]|nr:TonB-dependent receptor [bacterium]
MFYLIASFLLISDTTHIEQLPLYKLEEVVVTATKLPTPLKNAPVSVTILDSEYIKNINAYDVSDILNSVSSIKVEKYGGVGAVSGILTRGLYSSETQILIDGRPVNSPSLGGADLSWISPVNIDKIEIIRGPLSSVYGSNAIAGVINIITKDIENDNIHYSYGSWNTVMTSVSTGMKTGNLKYKVDAGIRNSAGARQNSAYKSNEINGKISYGKLDFQTGCYKGKVGCPGVEPAESTIYRYETQKQLGNDKVSSLYDFSNSEKFYINSCFKLSDLKLNGFINRWNDDSYSEWIGGYSPSFEHHIGNNNYKTSFYGIESQYTKQLLKKMCFMSGLSVQKSQFISTNKDSIIDNFMSTSSWDANQTIIAFYLQNELSVASFRLNLGCRAESILDYSSQISPRASIIWLVNSSIKVSAIYGKGFRAPTLNDLYYPKDAFSEGNPNLVPEKSESYELGAELHKKDFLLKITAFKQNTYDMIRWDAVGSIGPYGNKWTPANINKVLTNGIEVELNTDMTKYFNSSLSYTYLNALQENKELVRTDTLIVKEVRRQSAYIPEHKLNIDIGYKILKDLKTNISAEYISETYNYYQNWNNWPDISMDTKKLSSWVSPFFYIPPSYIIVNMNLHKKWKMFDTYFSVDNLFDEGYSKFGNDMKDRNYPLPGRNLNIGVTVTL